MKLHENRHIDFLLKLFYLALGLLAVHLVVRYLFRLVWPLLLGYVMSSLIRPPVAFLTRKRILPRSVSAGVFTLLVLSLFGFVSYILVARLSFELTHFAKDLPQHFESMITLLDRSLSSLFDKLPANFIPDISIDSILANIKLPQIGSVLFSLGRAATSLPEILLTFVFIFLSTFFFTSEYDAITGFLKRQLPKGATSAIVRLKHYLTHSLFGWVKAQLILIVITFCELSIGFSILKIDYVVLLAFFIALIDAMPILGVGTVLIPWALLDLLAGSYARAGGLLILYLVVLLVRHSLEPRIVAEQIGLNPFATLLGIYFGFRYAGFLGMFLFPLFILSLNKLNEWGYIKVWK